MNENEHLIYCVVLEAASKALSSSIREIALKYSLADDVVNELEEEFKQRLSQRVFLTDTSFRINMDRAEAFETLGFVKRWKPINQPNLWQDTEDIKHGNALFIIDSLVDDLFKVEVVKQYPQGYIKGYNVKADYLSGYLFGLEEEREKERSVDTISIVSKGVLHLYTQARINQLHTEANKILEKATARQQDLDSAIAIAEKKYEDQRRWLMSGISSSAPSRDLETASASRTHKPLDAIKKWFASFRSPGTVIPFMIALGIPMMVIYPFSRGGINEVFSSLIYLSGMFLIMSVVWFVMSWFSEDSGELVQ